MPGSPTRIKSEGGERWVGWATKPLSDPGQWSDKRQLLSALGTQKGSGQLCWYSQGSLPGRGGI